jgi:hypothetical protein
MGIVKGMNGLTNIIPELDKKFRYAVEVRNNSWIWHIVFLQITMCMVWFGVN